VCENFIAHKRLFDPINLGIFRNRWEKQLLCFQLQKYLHKRLKVDFHRLRNIKYASGGVGINIAYSRQYAIFDEKKHRALVWYFAHKICLSIWFGLSMICWYFFHSKQRRLEALLKYTYLYHIFSYTTTRWGGLTFIPIQKTICRF
jgi:hypothetical protein